MNKQQEGTIRMEAVQSVKNLLEHIKEFHADEIELNYETSIKILESNINAIKEVYDLNK